VLHRIEEGRGASAPRLWEKKMLNNIGLPGLLLIAVVVLVLFGRGKISSLMGEVGKGITAFKKGVKDGTEELENNVESAKDITPETETEKDKA
jgi:sec-independent protein translocase protein TatA